MSIAKRLKEDIDALGYRYYSALSSKSGIEECDGMAVACDGVNVGNIVGAQNMVGIDNSSRFGTNVHRGVKKMGISKAKRIMKGLKIVEADETENDPNDKKVVAQITQNVTQGDINRASRAAKLLADAGKIDKNTAANIEKQLKSVK